MKPMPAGNHHATAICTTTGRPSMALCVGQQPMLYRVGQQPMLYRVERQSGGATVAVDCGATLYTASRLKLAGHGGPGWALDCLRLLVRAMIVECNPTASR